MISTPPDLKSYKTQLRRALQNEFLATTLRTFASAYRLSRANAFEGLDATHLVEEIARGKDAAIPYLQELFEQFRSRAEAAGVKVHVARTPREANEIIASIARSNDVRKIVKSKSMTAEETFLNDHLEKEGFQVTETDLGEWIIQLRGEGPSHMVMPAIHLSRKEVAELFTGVTGEVQDPDDIAGMVQVARKELRQAYVEAHMGISGANFAVAETGTLGLITNEGNARLVTTLPPVHVALLGFEKLVPDLRSALRILQMLPRNATGQAISTYVTWITGANQCATGPDGRKAMHVVFLDNGRLTLARDPVFAEALRCIRCGACANVCPIYKLVGGHNYGHVYMGAIGLILTYFYHGRENARAMVKNCLNCQACKSVCASGIDLPRLIREVHRKILKEEGTKPVKNVILNLVLRNRRLFHFLLRRASLAQSPVASGERVMRHLPFFFDREHEFRSLPLLAGTPLRDRWNQVNPSLENPRLRVALFGGCLVDFVYPEQALALVKLFAAHDVQLEYPMEQTCCGLPAEMMGEKETARQVALQNLHSLDMSRFDHILTLCASCGSHLKESYPRLLEGEGDAEPMVRGMVEKVTDFSSFMINVLQVSPRQFQEGGAKTAYHSPCHLCRGLNVTGEPRELLTLAGLEYTPSRDEDVCCGFGGSFSVDFPMLSAEILREKLDHTEDTGADVLVTDCPGCVLQLRGGLDKRNSSIRVKHMVEIIAEQKKW